MNEKDKTENSAALVKDGTGTGSGAVNKKDKNGKSFSLVDEVLDWIESFIFASFIVLLVFIFLFRTVMVDGPSMNPTLYHSQRLILNHMNYTPERGDIVVFNCRGKLNKTLIKRCIGVAGDKVTVDYSTGDVTVNGNKLSEPYLGEPMELKPYFNDDYLVSDMKYEYLVPEGTVFVMGDNRNNSNDSRSSDVGFVNEEDILGHAMFRFYIGTDEAGSKNPGKIGFVD